KNECVVVQADIQKAKAHYTPLDNAKKAATGLHFLVERTINLKGPEFFRAMSLKQRRNTLSLIVGICARCVFEEVDVEDIFLKLGYLRPSAETIKLQNLPEYVYRAVDESKF